MNTTDTYVPQNIPRSATHGIRGVDCHVSEWGDPGDRLLVLLHGWGDSGSSFQFLVDQLQGDYHVIAPDWRGFGRSQHMAAGYWFPDYLADLHELLDIYSPAEPAWLLGHSMGGNVAGLYAGVYPDRVSAFVNVEGFGLPDSDPASAPDNFRRWIEKGRAMAAYSSYQDIDELAARILQRNPAMQLRQARFVAQHWSRSSGDGSVQIRADPAHKLPNAVLYRRAEAEACWSRISAAVLLVMGENSDYLEMASAWLDGPNCAAPFSLAARALIPGAGHMVHFEQPARLASTVETFLQTL
jgi:pimeloyl-ACP methyl ester carboxylesterase